MNVVPIVPGSRGFDTDTPLTATLAARLGQAGADFVVRYLGSITAQELEAITASGVGVALVTFSRAPGWTPSELQGVQDGAVDVTHLKSLDVPATMVVWIDLEGSGGDAVATSAWVNARAKALVDAGYIAGLYVGDGCVLNGAQLYALSNVTRYWRAFNADIPSPECGFCAMQLFPPNQTVGGVLVDLDVTQQDYHGRLPTMLTQ